MSQIKEILGKIRNKLIADGHYDKCDLDQATDNTCPVCNIDQALTIIDQLEAISKIKDKRIVRFEAMVKVGGELCMLQERIDVLSEGKAPEQPPSGKMTKRFNALIEELKQIFTVSQAIARNSFDSTTQPIKSEPDNPDPPPDHKYPAPEQPPSGEFTKGLRQNVREFPDFPVHLRDLFEKDILKACKIIDRSEAENKALRRPLEAFNFKVDGMLAVGNELIKKDLKIKNLESINKELLGVCEEFMERADDGSADFDDPAPGSIFIRASAIITKAKKEGGE